MRKSKGVFTAAFRLAEILVARFFLFRAYVSALSDSARRTLERFFLHLSRSLGLKCLKEAAVNKSFVRRCNLNCGFSFVIFKHRHFK